MDSVTDSTRPRGLLNERERRYLLGQTDIEPHTQPERDIRATIRNRLTHAIYDFALLFDHLEDRDLAQVFDARADDAAELRTALEEMLGFLYRASIDFHPPFHYLAKEGIQRAELTHFDRYVKASIDVEPTAPIDPGAIKQKMASDRPERLTPEEAQWIAETVVASGDFSFADLDDAHEHLRKLQSGTSFDERNRQNTDRD